MATVSTPFGGANIGNKTLGVAALGIVAIGAAVTYRLGYWGNYKVGTDQNANITIDKSKLDDQTGIEYKNIAENLYREFNKTGLTKFTVIRDMLSGLNTEELKQVVKDFGARNSTVVFTGLAMGDKMNLFTWMEKDIDSQQNLDALKTIFLPTKLWSAPSYGTGETQGKRGTTKLPKR